MGKLIFLQMETPSAPGSSAAQNVEVGPIWNQRHAEEKAAEYVRNHPEFQWTGHWWTTEPGIMSVIQIERRNPDTSDPINHNPSAAQNVEVGPIWNQRHAEEKAAEYVRNHPEFQWTGHWWTTEPGMMSVIQIERRNPETENMPVAAIHEDE